MQNLMGAVSASAAPLQRRSTSTPVAAKQRAVAAVARQLRRQPQLAPARLQPSRTLEAAASSSSGGSWLDDPIEARPPVAPAPSLYSEDLAPVPPEGRTFSAWDMASLWVGLVGGWRGVEGWEGHQASFDAACSDAQLCSATHHHPPPNQTAPGGVGVQLVPGGGPGGAGDVVVAGRGVHPAGQPDCAAAHDPGGACRHQVRGESGARGWGWWWWWWRAVDSGMRRAEGEAVRRTGGQSQARPGTATRVRPLPTHPPHRRCFVPLPPPTCRCRFLCSRALPLAPEARCCLRCCAAWWLLAGLASTRGWAAQPSIRRVTHPAAALGWAAGLGGAVGCGWCQRTGLES